MYLICQKHQENGESHGADDCPRCKSEAFQQQKDKREYVQYLVWDLRKLLERKNRAAAATNSDLLDFLDLICELHELERWEP